MGPKAAVRAGQQVVALAGSGPVAVAGFCGGLRPEIRTGDVIVASEVRGAGGVLTLPYAAAVAQALRSAGLTVHVGPIAVSDRVAFGKRRVRAGADGSFGVDMESYWLLEGRARPQARAPGPAVVVRAVSDTAGRRPFGGMLPMGWLRAYWSLARVGPALELWAGALDAGTEAAVGNSRDRSVVW